MSASHETAISPAVVHRHLTRLTKAVSQAAIGNYHQHLAIPTNEDGFTELYVGIKLLLESIQEKVNELEEVNRIFAENLTYLEEYNKRVEREKAVNEAIINGLGEGMVVVDKKTNVVIINPQAEVILGRKSSEVIGKNWFRIIKARDEYGKAILPENRPLFQTISERKKVNSVLIVYNKKEHAHIPVAVSSSPVVLDGEVIGGVNIFRDITQEKEIDTTKTEVISFTSHQLRTPLSVINWYSEKLLSGDFGPVNQKQREYLQAIYTTAQKTTGLVNTFLNVSRLQLGTFPVNPRVVDLQRVVADVLHELEPKIEARKLTVSRRSPQTVALAWADPKLIRIVLQNLISNSVKYTPVGGSITYELSVVEKGIDSQSKRFVQIRLKDNGYGIPKKQQPHIFSKLFRAENIKELDIEGSGLGLYMVKNIVHHLKGEITFHSKVNKGTTFYVQLPSAIDYAPDKLPVYNKETRT